MEKQDIQELAETTYGLIVVLEDILWKFEGFSKDNQRKFTGMLALIDTIEENSYNIKVSLECLQPTMKMTVFIVAVQTMKMSVFR